MCRDIRVDERVVLKWILKMVWPPRLHSHVPWLVPVAGRCEQDNALSGFVKDGTFFTGWVTVLKIGSSHGAGSKWTLWQVETCRTRTASCFSNAISATAHSTHERRIHKIVDVFIFKWCCTTPVTFNIALRDGKIATCQVWICVCLLPFWMFWRLWRCPYWANGRE
jgi:hypothetical protein